MSFLDKLNRFAKNPVFMDMKRSKFNLSHGSKTTMNAGTLVPIMVDEVLPDDTIKIDVASVVRGITAAVPVMDNAYLDIYAFWCPARICTRHPKDWEKIQGENFNGAWAPATESTIENTGNSIALTSAYAIQPQSLGDYLGIPIGFYNTNVKVNIMPFIGLLQIYNHWFRSEDITSYVSWETWSDSTFSMVLSQANEITKTCKFHDYFTSALPAPQKGGAVLLPLAGDAPIKTSSTDTVNVNGAAALKFKAVATGLSYGAYTLGTTNDGTVTHDATTYSPIGTGAAPSNLYADLTNATASSVNDLRHAFALQKLLEKDARGGTRYKEILLTHFGVSIPDNTIQIPEYLGGKRIPLNQLQVIQTAPTSASPLGTTGSFSNTADSSYICTKSFSEYGYIYLLAVLLKDPVVPRGLADVGAV